MMTELMPDCWFFISDIRTVEVSLDPVSIETKVTINLANGKEIFSLYTDYDAARKKAETIVEKINKFWED